MRFFVFDGENFRKKKFGKVESDFFLYNETPMFLFFSISNFFDMARTPYIYTSISLLMYWIKRKHVPQPKFFFNY